MSIVTVYTPLTGPLSTAQADYKAVSLVSSNKAKLVVPHSRAGSLWVSMTELVGTEKVTVAVWPSWTETVLGVKESELIVAVVHGSVTVMSKTVFSASVEGVKVVEPEGPFEAMVNVLESLTV